MMNYSEAQPNAPLYEMLLRAAMKCQDMAAEIYNEAQGCIDDFRVLALLRIIAEHNKNGKRIKHLDLLRYVQGNDLKAWFMSISWSLPDGDAVEHRRYWQDAIARLSKAKVQRLIDAATVEADKALKNGNQKRYVELLTDMQTLRRQAKKIMF